MIPVVTTDPREIVVSAARQVAETIAPYLEARLRAVEGPAWLAAVNARRAAASHPPGRGLHDHRFCLALLGYDPATEGWADEPWRAHARQLNALANKALHDDPLSASEVDRAVAIAQQFTAWQHRPRGATPANTLGTSPSSRSADSTPGRPAIGWGRSPQAVEWERHARRMLDAKQWDQAIEATSRWVELEPASDDAREDHLHALFMAEQFDRLVVLMEQGWQEVGYKPHRLETKAMALLDLDRNAEAAATAAQALALDDSLTYAWRTQARALRKLGQTKGAIAAARRALRDNPQDEHMWSIVGDALFEERRWYELLEVTEQWTEARPSPEMWLYKTWALLGLNRFDEAQQAAETLVTLTPNDPAALGLAAKTYKLSSDLVKAREHAERWVAVEPDSPGAHEILEWVVAQNRTLEDIVEDLKRKNAGE
jgi:tetratricopeptide (TPR) repeat protein